MTTTRHFKFINSKTGNAIYYHTLNTASSAEKVKAELEKIKEQVATQNGIFSGTLYWEEIVEEK